MIARVLSRLAPRLPRRDLFGREGLYLSRFTLARLGAVRVYLNRFWRSDEDLELHNHPWRWAISLILSGGYVEERRTHDGCDFDVDARELRPGHLNLLGPDTFHRVDGVQPETWTLFVAGPRIQDWGFWNRTTHAVTPWREFITSKGLPLSDEGWAPKTRRP